MDDYTYFVLSFGLFLCFILEFNNCLAFKSLSAIDNGRSSHISSMQQFFDVELSDKTSLNRRQAPMTQHTDSEADSCVSDDFTTKIAAKLHQNMFNKTFSNDSHANITVLWTGNDDSIMMVVTLSNVQKPSTFYISEDFGKTFKNLTDRLNNVSIVYIHQNPVDRKWVVFVSDTKDSMNTTTVFITSDGINIKMILLPFVFSGEVTFHPTDSTKLLMIDGGNDTKKKKKVWLSVDGLASWKLVHDDVSDVSWSQVASDENGDVFYFTNGSTKLNKDNGDKQEFDLVRVSNSGNDYGVISRRVLHFKVMGKFLFALVATNQKQKKSILKVSTDVGRHWNEAQLPIRVEDQFYEILDMSEGMVFIHVDDPSGSGRGVLFTSDSDGIVYSESLRNHIYEKNNRMNDFYKVQSMRGVYITSRYINDRNVQTVITFNRGATWSSIRNPSNVDCFSSDQTKCALQIVSQLQSTKQNHFAMSPLSSQSAVGIILAHGHTSDFSLDPDIYVSADGGYNWTKVLTGPHLYAIADHGGLLVAVPDPKDHATDTVKFSLDEGQTWYCYQFSKEKIRITGLLTDPASWSLKVGIWGFGLNDSVWRVTVVDFQPIMGRQCIEPDDFTNFMAHNEISKNRSRQGCLLGSKETFRRVKKGTKCFLGQAHVTVRLTDYCNCTEDDYECDFGFSRVNNGGQCKENPRFKGAELDICLDGEEKKIVTAGYRKIPGDVCKGGYNPGERYEEAVKVKCREGDILMGSLRVGPAGSAAGLVILVILIVIMTGLIFGMSVFFIRKFHQISTSPISYRYSRLSQDDDPQEDETMRIVTSNLASDRIGSSSEDEMQPATLLIDTCDTTEIITINSNGVTSRASARKMYDESDEELLQ